MAEHVTETQDAGAHSSPIPGTNHLVDREGTMRAKHASGAIKDVVLVPTPSSDPDDPLNWSPKRRLLAVTCVCVYTLAVGFPTAAIYSVFMPISMNTGLSFDTLNSGTGYMFLLLGWGCAFWQPIALQYGKRPVYLFTLFATTGIILWGPYAKTKGDWIAGKILQGFFGAPIESLCEISMTDLTFTHNRGTYMAIYALFLGGSNFLAPVFAGFISDGQDWRWVLYWCSIFCGLSFVFLFFCMEETNYDRPNSSITATVVSDDEKYGEGSEKGADPTTEVASPTTLGPSQKTFLSKLSLLDKPRPFKKFLFMLKQPFIFFTYPVVVYSGFAYGSALIWFNVLNGTASIILGGPGYNFKPSMVGLSYLSPLLGNILTTIWAGTIGDKLLVLLARRNGGTNEPEHRLWLFVLMAIFCPVGLILWGVGAAHGVHWFGLISATFILSFSISIAIPVSVNYCIDTYQALSGQALVTIMIIRNTMSFAVSYGITPWLTDLGYQNCFISAAMIALASSLVFLIFVKWGKGMRISSKDRYWRMVKESEAMGVSH
ncbi:major facilitator superfamily domain-containing protein [Amylocarpus encephaloides]|uniref:Major facilitator superfamily domain-containing protein n=1 Tax=Amylocarpus encephaloides TaxID=45428 RepID=A0A9P7YLU4_9HELO|nr:major facilitator superfamily domain-containing protein [Amylocarpus encephaloides]